jgi:hypothetical protein
MSHRARRRTIAAAALGVVLTTVPARGQGLALVLPQTPTRSITVEGGSVSLPNIHRTDPVGKTATGASLAYDTDTAGDVVTAAVDASLPTGVTLTIEAVPTACSGGCSGDPGASTGVVAVLTAPSTIIDGIGAVSGATADLIYTVTTSDAATGAGSVVVTYTIAGS